MRFRLAIFPAGAVDSAAAAAKLVPSMRRGSRSEPPPAITEVLGALDGSPVGHYIDECRHCSNGALLSVDYPECGLLEALLILAKDHDLAVYDIILKRLYDPTGSVEVDVSMPGVRLPFLTRDLLSDLVASPQWPDPEAPYVIVDRAEQDFIQAWLDADGVYQVEYREGGPESHFEFRTEDAQRVVEVMWAWAIGDESWRSAVDWWFLDVEAADAARASMEPRSVSLQSEHRDDGSRLTMTAERRADGQLEILGQDLGPVTRSISGDGEYEWGYTVAADDVPALVIALGGEAGEDVIDVLERRWSGENVYGLGAKIRSSGVSHEFWNYF